MQYDEKTASKIQAQFGLSDGAKRSWQFRDAIPDRYFERGFSPATYLDDEATAMLRTALAQGKLSAKNLCAATEVPYFAVQDALAGKNRMNANFAARLSEGIRSLAAQAQAIVDIAGRKREAPEQAIRLLEKLVRKEELSVGRIFPDRQKYDTLQAWKRGRRTFPSEHFPYFLDMLKLFATQHSI